LLVTFKHIQLAIIEVENSAIFYQLLQVLWLGKVYMCKAIFYGHGTNRLIVSYQPFLPLQNVMWGAVIIYEKLGINARFQASLILKENSWMLVLCKQNSQKTVIWYDCAKQNDNCVADLIGINQYSFII